MQSVKASCGCVGIIDGENFIPMTFNCSKHKIGVKHVYSLHLRKKRTTIEVKNVKPHLEELILRCGGIPQAADYSGLTSATVQRIMKGQYKTVQIKTAQKIMDSLILRRADDRRNYGVNKTLIDTMRKRAISEDKIIRKQQEYEDKLQELTGY